VASKDTDYRTHIGKPCFKFIFLLNSFSPIILFGKSARKFEAISPWDHAIVIFEKKIFFKLHTNLKLKTPGGFKFLMFQSKIKLS
jgi:hypothetical protein